jgi:hypothetical protein
VHSIAILRPVADRPVSEIGGVVWSGAARDDAARTVMGDRGPVALAAVRGCRNTVALTRVAVQAFVALSEQVQAPVGLLENINLPVQRRHAQGCHLVGATRGPGLRGLPGGAHHSGLLEPAQRAVHGAGVTVDGMEHPQPVDQVISMVRAFAEEQQQTGLQEVPRFALAHAKPPNGG